VLFRSHKVNFQKCSRLHKTELYKQKILLDPHGSANSFTHVSRFSANPETYFFGVLNYNVLPITKASPRKKFELDGLRKYQDWRTRIGTHRELCPTNGLHV
jgi:hypothetical protein